MRNPRACLPISACLVLVMYAVSAIAGATTYYVATSGNNANSGTSLASPFRTVSHAAGLVSPGDIIEVRAGTYAENVLIRRAGSANAWITLRGYNGERPVIRRSGSGPTLYFYRSECDESTIGNGNGNVDCLPMFWTVEGIEVRGSPSGGGDGNAIKIDTPKVSLRNNRLCCSVADVVKLVRTANDVEISGNEIWQDASITVPGGNAQGIDIVGADRSQVIGNYVHDVPDFGIYAKGNARETVLANNLLVNIGGNALMLGQSTDAARLLDGVHETYDGIIRNNVVVNATWACLATASSTRVRIYNNSCHNTGTSTHGSILLSNESEIGTHGLDIEIANNAIHGSANRPVIRITSNAMADYGTLKIDRNIYYIGGGNPRFHSSDHFNVTGMAAWTTAYTALSGRHDSSLSSDPRFITTSGIHPLAIDSTSPALDAGLNLAPWVSDDRLGTARPQGPAFDIGAYELGLRDRILCDGFESVPGCG